MTFSTKLKEEIAANKTSNIVMESELASIIRYDSTIKDGKITFSFENGAIARKVYKSLKEVFRIPINIIIRNQKRLRAKQIYILEITSNTDYILHYLHINKNLDAESLISDKEEVMGFCRGAFLACGSVNDPSTSGYHLEFVFQKKKDALFLDKVLHMIKFNSKVLKRGNRYMVYLKSSEEISDMIRFFEAPNSLFYFEDIRIYRDHKNMLNRLNNCDLANQEKSLKTGQVQLDQINFLKEHDLISLLDEKTLLVIEARCKYPEASFQELADIITNESNYKIGKSGVNHHFIKIKKLIDSYQKSIN